MSSYSMEVVLLAAVVGIVVGWLATVVVKGWGLGLIGNLILGIIGAIVVTFIMRQIGLPNFPFDSLGTSPVGPIAQAVVGALVFLLVVGITRKRTA